MSNFFILVIIIETLVELSKQTYCEQSCLFDPGCC